MVLKGNGEVNTGQRFVGGNQLIVLVLLGLFAAGCSTVVQTPNTLPAFVGDMNFAQARQSVLTAIESESTGVYISGVFFSSHHAKISVRITGHEFSVFHDRAAKLASVDLRSLRPVSAGKFVGSYYVSDTGSGVNPSLTGAQLHIYLKNEHTAKALATAINWLIDEAKGVNKEKRALEFEAFKLEARAWRELTTKPGLSAEAARQRILAEHAIGEKDYTESLKHYEMGLAATPLWPEGHYNAALLCAEIGGYSQAVEHMRRYLELAPDAPDATKAREKLIVWEEKAK